MRPILIFLFLFSPLLCQDGNSIKGIITDQRGNPLPQANISLEPGKKRTTSDDDGAFFLMQIPGGEYHLTVEYTGFQIYSSQFHLSSDKVFTISLLESPIEVKGITTTAMRATRENSPVTFSEISSEAIIEAYNVQDVPMLLQYTPGAFSYSETGTGIGYTHFNIRGFNQQRMNVMINGIPQNDPESHGVYWVDLPDILNNTDDVQIQRGVGFSTDGSAAFGGSINLQTKAYGNTRSANFEAGYGSYNTRKLSTSYGTGMLGNYSFYGRFSVINSDGYRDHTAADLYSWFVSGSYFGEKSTWQFNAYGGQEITQLAWNGANPEMIAQNRKANDIKYSNEVDNYIQPHFELLFTHQASEDLQISANLFYIYGEGYYEQFKEAGSYRWAEYLLPDSIETDKFIQKWLKNHHYGIQANLTYRSSLGETNTGFLLRKYVGDHFGDIVQAKDVDFEVLDPPLRFYSNQGNKNYASLFVNHLWPASSNLNFMFDIQFRYIDYERQQEEMSVYQGYNLKVDYLFINPKFGLMYKINKDLNIFASAGVSNREPTGNDYFDPKDPSAIPNYDIKSERVYDFEGGIRYNFTELVIFDLNLYYMAFENEILANGQVDDEGNFININADNSFRSGIEFRLSGSTNGLSYGINGSFSYNRISSYFEYVDEFDSDWNYVATRERTYTDVKTAFSPEMIFNSYLGYSASFMNAYLQHNYVGEQFVENTESAGARVESYSIFHFFTNINLPSFFGGHPVLTFRINNLLDTDYWQPAFVWWKWIQNGTTNYDTRYYVGAPRNYYICLKLNF